MKRRWHITTVTNTVLLVSGALFLSACSGPGPAAPSAATPAKPREKTRVGVVRPERKDLERKIVLPGTLAAWSETTLYGKVAGYLKSISVDKGDRVRAGQGLALLEVPEMAKELDQAEAILHEAQATLNKAQADLALQKTTYERYRGLQHRDPDAISNQEVDEWRAKSELAQAEAQLAEAKVATARANHDRLAALEQYARITAPFDGVITARFVDPGALIQAATSSVQAQPIVTIADLTTMRTYIYVPEVEVANVRRGNKVTLAVAAYPGKVFPGSVTRFAEAVDPATRTMKTEIDISNRERRLRPGMFVEVTLDLETHPRAIVIPDTALVLEGPRKFVLLVREGTVHRVAVVTGLDDSKQAEVLSGLKGDESVIVAGKEDLREGQPVEPSPLQAWMK